MPHLLLHHQLPQILAHYLPQNARNSPSIILRRSAARITTRKASDVVRSRGNSGIRCMANPRRVKMVAKQIQRELSDMLLTDKVLQYAILPEAALGADRYLSSLTTISDVEVSADLQVKTPIFRVCKVKP